MEKEIEKALQVLRSHEPIVIPTETVYGLAAPIFDEVAVRKIFSIKQRPEDNPLIAHIGKLSQVHQIAVDIPQEFYTLAEAFFPGPLTIVLKKHPSVPLVSSGGLNTIAVRMPCHPITLEVLKRVGEPLVAPSANISGRPSPTCVEHVLEDLNGKVSCIIDGGPCVYGLESTVLSLVEDIPTLLRPGEISQEVLSARLGKQVAVGAKGEFMSPGMRYKHYAPSARIILFESLDEIRKRMETEGVSKKWLLMKNPKNFPMQTFALLRSNLYSLFRRADQSNCDEIWIYVDPEMKKDHTMMNRVLKATDL